MTLYDTIIYNLPEVAAPKQTRLAFKEKLKWTPEITMKEGLTKTIEYFRML